MKYFILFPLLFILCANKSIESKQVAKEQKSKFVTEVVFKRNGSTLSSNAKNEIRRLIYRAAQAGKIDEVKLVTWGDTEYPSASTVKLSPAEQALVNKRNTALEEYIDTLHARIDVEKMSSVDQNTPAMASTSMVIVTLEE